VFLLCEGAWHIIDFGLARKYTNDSGGVLAERQGAAFRGSTAYASLFAHREQDLGNAELCRFAMAGLMNTMRCARFRVKGLGLGCRVACAFFAWFWCGWATLAPASSPDVG
jgi:hypothetical protein